MKPRIILHIGTEKTGSTSIQSFLAASYDELIERRILFPKTLGKPCHIKFTSCVLGDEPNHPIRKLLGIEDEPSFAYSVNQTKCLLKNEIESTSPNTLLISDEHIGRFLPGIKYLRSFKELCEEFGDIKAVIVYLRRQDEFQLSLFSEAVKSGNLSEFDILNPLPIFEEIPYRLNYLSMLDNLANVFGKSKIYPRIYDRKSFPNADVCADFLQVSGINIGLLPNIKQEKNLSIDGMILKRLAFITLIFKSSRNIFIEKIRKKIIKICENNFRGQGIILPKEKHVDFLIQFEEQNKIIKEKYFNKSTGEGLFSIDFAKHQHKKSYYPDYTISWLKFIFKIGIGLVSRK